MERRPNPHERPGRRSRATALAGPFLICRCLAYSSVTIKPHFLPQRRSLSSLRALQTETDLPLQTKASGDIDRSALSRLDACGSRTAALNVLSRALYPPSSPRSSDEEETNRLFDSVKIPKNASTRPVSDAELSLQTRTINSKYKITELIEQNGDRDIDRASLAVLCVFLFGSSSAILAQQATAGLPDIVRWLIVFALCFSPLVLVGYGLALPAELSAALVAIQRRIFPSYRTRMIQHEAGHFLIGYLLGWPVKTYQAGNAVKNAVEFYPLSDEDAGADRAQALGFDVRKKSNDDSSNGSNAVGNDIDDAREQPYFSRDGRGAVDKERSVFRDKDAADSYFSLAPQDDPTSAWPFRGFDDETLDKFAIMSVAGACAEILAYGNAEGGVADLLQLRRIYGAAANNGNSGKTEEGASSPLKDDARDRRLRRENERAIGGMDEREMDNRTRFALGYAMGLLRQHLGSLDALAKVMEDGGSVAECVLALEECSNVSGQMLKGDYDKIRREQFRARDKGFGGWVERSFLGGSKSIDVEDSEVIEGKGGGDRKQAFQLTGDDPLYAAMAVAVAFFAWASNGGLSLH
ncbi:hypothetical protein ACHAWF_005378 [Thalassiosira exigua]